MKDHSNRNLPTRIVEGGIQSIALSSSAGYLLGKDGSLDFRVQSIWAVRRA